MLLFDKQKKRDAKERKSVIAEAPLKFRKTVSSLLDAEDAEDFNEMLRLAEILEEAGADEKFWIAQMATAYLGLGKPRSAEQYVDKLYAENGEELSVVILKAVCCQLCGDVIQAEQILEQEYPPKEYIPFYYSTYADVLEKQGRLQESYEKYQVVCNHFQEGYDPGEILMDGVFQRVIELGMIGGLDSVNDDMDAYISFLKEIENTVEMQERVSDNLVLFSHYLTDKEYWEPFRRLADSLTESDFMPKEPFAGILRTAYISLESYEIHEDSTVSKFMADLINYAVAAASLEEQKAEAPDSLSAEQEEDLYVYRTEAVTMKYLTYKRLPGIFTELDSIREKYPYTYDCLADFDKELREDARSTTEKYRRLTIEGLGDGEHSKSSFDKFYEEMYGGGKLMWDSGSGSYERVGKKIGRNDPCPCGSGKKYKHCCGRK